MKTQICETAGDTNQLDEPFAHYVGLQNGRGAAPLFRKQQRKRTLRGAFFILRVPVCCENAKKNSHRASADSPSKWEKNANRVFSLRMPSQKPSPAGEGGPRSGGCGVPRRAFSSVTQLQNGGDAAYTSSVTASPRHLLPLEKAFVPLPRWTDGGFIVIPSRWFGGRSKPLPYG